MNQLLETDLYGPIKALFETEGFEVKAEIGASMLLPFVQAKIR